MTAGEPTPSTLAWVGVGVLTLIGAMSGLLEAVLVPLYVDGTVFPICVVLALASNVALPRMSRSLAPSTLAAVLPFAGWLVVILGFGAVARPEGDVILPGGGALMYASYGVMLGGALAGTISVVTSAPPPVAPRTKGQGAAGGSVSGSRQ